MKLLETFRIRAAAAVRRRKARYGLGEKPARLEIRLDGFDAPGPVTAEALRVDQWQDRIVEAIQWIGPVPLRITAAADHAFLPDLVRFGHRLEMPVTVRTNPEPLSVERAEELVDRGMATCEVVTTLDGAGEAAIRALVHARHSRAATLTVVVHFPVTAATAAGARAVFDKARGLGADGVVLAAPWRGFAVNAAAKEGIAEALAQGWPLQRTAAEARAVLGSLAEGGPGVRRTSGQCALGGLRLALGPDGAASVCPFHVGHHSGPLVDAPSALAAHRAAVRSCDRRCGHPELV